MNLMNRIFIIVCSVFLGCAPSMPKQALWEPPASEVEPLSEAQLVREADYQEVVHTINDPSISCDALLEMHLNYTELLLTAAYWYNKRSRQEPISVAQEILENKIAAIAMYGEDKWKETPDPEELYSWLGPRTLRKQVAVLKGILAIGFDVLDLDCGIDAVTLEAITYGDPEAIRQNR